MTPDEEIKFIQDYKDNFITGDELINQYSRLIYLYLHRMNVNHQDFYDAYQDSCIVLLDAIDRWDYKRAKFSTYLLHRLRGVVTNYRRQDKENSICVSFDEMHANGFDIAAIDQEIDAFGDSLKKAISILSEEEKEIVILYFFKEETTSQIAKKFGFPRGSFDNRLNKILKKMRDAFFGKQEEIKQEKKKEIKKKLENCPLSDEQLNALLEAI